LRTSIACWSARACRGEFGNGDLFYAKFGELIDLPDRKIDRPQREFLQWHIDTVFKAS
jgi:putative restriction endonuclease